MNKSIIQFLKDQTCASICCIDEQGKPYCFSCFYAFNEEEVLLYFKSSPNAHHSVLMKTNHFVAGTVLPDKLSKLLVKGMQFEGFVLSARHPLMKGATGNYFTQHPLALAIPGEIWAIRIDQVKMTDNTLGFGKKISWSRTGKPAEITVG
jgi:uncharacterized protein YhbP (UPF0306 family)